MYEKDVIIHHTSSSSSSSSSTRLSHFDEDDDKCLALVIVTLGEMNAVAAVVVRIIAITQESFIFEKYAVIHSFSSIDMIIDFFERLRIRMMLRCAVPGAD